MKVKATIRPADNQDQINAEVEVNVQYIDVPEQPGVQDIVVFYDDKHHFMRWNPDMKNTTKYLIWPVNNNQQLLVVELDEIVD